MATRLTWQTLASSLELALPLSAELAPAAVLHLVSSHLISSHLIWLAAASAQILADNKVHSIEKRGGKDGDGKLKQVAHHADCCDLGKAKTQSKIQI